MIKIRYSDLPAGLHASASSEGRHTIIHLVPGLSAADRHGAIDRLRASARVGHGPKLSMFPLALALIADGIRTNLRNAAAAARLHPVGAAVPVVVLAAGAILYALFVTVSIRIGPLTPAAASALQPVSADPASPAGGASAAGPGDADPTSVFRLTGSGPANSSQRKAGVTRGQVTSDRPGPSSGRSPIPGPSVGPPRPGHSSPPPPGSPSPSLSPSPATSHSACLNLGMFGICLNA